MSDEKSIETLQDLMTEVSNTDTTAPGYRLTIVDEADNQLLVHDFEIIKSRGKEAELRVRVK